MLDDELTQAEIAASDAELAAARIGERDYLVETDNVARETLHFDEAGAHLRRVEDVESVLEFCKQRYSEGIVNRFCEFRHMAELPVSALEVWAAANGHRGLPAGWMYQKQYHDLVIRAAHDSDLAGFRTAPGVFR
jgi:hypothetical protein